MDEESVMASKGWTLLLLMVSVLTVTLAVGSLCLYPSMTVRLSPQGSAVIVAPVPELIVPAEPAIDVFPAPPTLDLSPAYDTSESHAIFPRTYPRRGGLRDNGHKPHLDTHNGFARRICDFDG